MKHLEQLFVMKCTLVSVIQNSLIGKNKTRTVFFLKKAACLSIVITVLYTEFKQWFNHCIH